MQGNGQDSFKLIRLSNSYGFQTNANSQHVSNGEEFRERSECGDWCQFPQMQPTAIVKSSMRSRSHQSREEPYQQLKEWYMVVSTGSSISMMKYKSRSKLERRQGFWAQSKVEELLPQICSMIASLDELSAVYHLCRTNGMQWAHFYKVSARKQPAARRLLIS